MIAKIYWRTIRRGTRTIMEVRDEMRDAVKAAAAQDVVNGRIGEEEYVHLIGEAMRP